MKNLFFVIFSIVFISCQGQKLNTDKVAAGEQIENGKSADQIFKENISVVEAEELMAANAEIILLDVRTPQEIALGKIGNASEIDYSAPDFKNKIETLDKNKEYIVYCAAGGRSARAVEMMKQLGFTKAHNLTPGYSGWSASK